MLPNVARGEVAAVLGGREVRLCVTLGGLAALEGYFQISGLEALGARLQRMRAVDLPVVVRALAMDEVGEVGVEAMAAVVAAFEAMNERVTFAPPPHLGSKAAVVRSPSPTSGEVQWSAILRAAVAMGLTPDAFWRLSWREWRMLTGDATPRLARPELEALMARFPDGGT